MGHRNKAVFKGAGGRKYLTGLILDIDFWSPIWETSSNNYREEVLPPGTKPVWEEGDEEDPGAYWGSRTSC